MDGPNDGDWINQNKFRHELSLFLYLLYIMNSGFICKQGLQEFYLISRNLTCESGSLRNSLRGTLPQNDCMNRTQRIVTTSVLSAIYVPAMYWLPVWCLGSGALRNVLWDLSYLVPNWAVPPLMGTFAIIGFAITCGIFAWLIARIWR